MTLWCFALVQFAAAATIEISAGDSLARAVSNARSGDVLVLSPGVHPEPAYIDGKSITIRGAGSGQTTIRGQGQFAIAVLNGAELTLQGVTVAGDGAIDLGVVARGAKVTANDVVITGFRGEAMQLQGNYEYTCSSCHLRGNSGRGLTIAGGARAQFDDLQITDLQGDVGVFLAENSTLLINGGQFTNISGAGFNVVASSLQATDLQATTVGQRFLVGGNGAQMEIRTSGLKDIRGDVVFFAGPTTNLTLEGVNLEAFNGFGIYGDSANVQLSGSAMSQGRNLAAILKGSTLTAESNVISDLAGGVAVEGGEVSFRDNIMLRIGNSNPAISVRDARKGEVVDNQFNQVNAGIILNGATGSALNVMGNHVLGSSDTAFTNNAIASAGSPSAIVLDNVFIGIGKNGVLAVGKSQTFFQDNVIISAGNQGLLVVDQASATLNSNIFSGSSTAVYVEPEKGAQVSGGDNITHGRLRPGQLNIGFDDGLTNKLLGEEEAQAKMGQIVAAIQELVRNGASSQEIDAQMPAFAGLVDETSKAANKLVNSSAVPAVVPVAASPYPAGYDDPEYFHRQIVDTRGRLKLTFHDLSVSGRGAPLQLIRTYLDGRATDAAFGLHWSSSQRSRVNHRLRNSLLVRHEDGNQSKFVAQNNRFVPELGLPTTSVQHLQDGSYLRQLMNGGLEYFDRTGRLVGRGNSEGMTQSLIYSGEFVVAVREISGRNITFERDGPRMLRASIADFSQSYGYADSKLTSVTDQAGRTTRFEYDVSGLLSALQFFDGGKLNISRNVIGQVVKLQGPGRLETTFSYDIDLASSGYKSVMTDATGRQFTREDVAADDGTLTQKYSAGTDAARVDSANAFRPGQLGTSGPNGAANTTYDANSGMLTIQPNGLAPTTLSLKSQTVGAVEFDGRGYPLQVNWEQGTAVPEFDDSGRLTKITSANGQVVEYQYDAAGWLTGRRIGPQVIEEIERDAAGRPTRIKRGDTDWAATYDELGLPTELRDGDTAWKLSYDAAARLIEIIGEEESLRIEYDAAGLPVRYENGLGETVTVTRDNQGIITFNSSQEGQFSVQLATNGTPVRATLGEQQTLVTEFQDAVQRTTNKLTGEVNELRKFDDGSASARTILDGELVLETQTNAQAQVTSRKIVKLESATDSNEARETVLASETYVYDEQGHLVSTTNSRSQVHSWKWDDQGRPRQLDSKNGVVAMDYDHNGQLAEISLKSDLVNRTIKYEYAGGELSLLTNSDGRSLSIKRDEQGRTTSVSVNGATSEFDYDQQGRVALVRDETGESLFKYDDLERLVEVTGPQALKYTYEGNSPFPSSHENALGQKWLFAYDEKGQLQSVTDPLGRSSQQSRDEQGRVIEFTDAGGRGFEVSWTNDNRVSTMRVKGGAQIEFDHNGFGDKTSLVTGLGTKTFTYDAQGNLLTLFAGDQQIQSAEYDDSGNLAAAKTPLGEYQFAHDGDGRIVKEITAAGTSLEYSYNQLGQLVQTQLNGQSFAHDGWDASGRLIGREFAGGHSWQLSRDWYGRLIGIDAGEISLSVVYAAGGLVSQMDLTEASSQQRQSLLLQRDALGRVVNREFAGSSRSLTYDAAGRLASVDEGGDSSAVTYDASGNITEKDGIARQYDTAYRLTSLGDADVFHDASGALVSINGELELTRDAAGRVITAQRAGGQMVRYGYDYRGRIARREMGSSVWNYIYDDNEIVAVADAGGQVMVRFERLAELPGTMRLVANDGASQFLLSDPLGTPVALVGNGQISDQSMDVWGDPKSGKDVLSATYGAYGYTGAVQDPDTGLVFMGARVYLPELGRFLSVDPAGPAGGIINPYAYAANAPSVFNDPSGLNPSIEFPFGGQNYPYPNPRFNGPLAPSAPSPANMQQWDDLVRRDLERIARKNPGSPRANAARETLNMIDRKLVRPSFERFNPRGDMGAVRGSSPRTARVYVENVRETLRGNGIRPTNRNMVRAMSGILTHEVTHTAQRARNMRTPFVLRELEARMRHALIDPRMAGTRPQNLRHLVHQTLAAAQQHGRSISAMTPSQVARLAQTYAPGISAAQARMAAHQALIANARGLSPTPGTSGLRGGPLSVAPNTTSPFGTASRMGPALRAGGRVLARSLGPLSFGFELHNYMTGQTSTSHFVVRTATSAFVAFTPFNPVSAAIIAHDVGALLGTLAANHVISVINDPNHPHSQLYQDLFGYTRQERSRHPCALNINCDCQGIEAGILTRPWRQHCRGCQLGMRQQCMREYQADGNAARAISTVGFCNGRCSVYGPNYQPKPQ